MTIHILGGGPAGIALSYYLSKLDIESVVYEKQPMVGGMARSWRWSDYIVDTGPHILHSPELSIWEEWTQILGKALISQDYFSANYKERNNKNFLFDYPINITQLMSSAYWSESERDKILEELSKDNTDSIAAASSFAEYTKGLVGSLVSEHFFTVYPEKVWGIPTTEMLPDWAPKRIRRTTCLEPFFGDQYAGVSACGTGYLFEQMANSSSSSVGNILCNSIVTSLQYNGGRITEIEINSLKKIPVSKDDLVINTLPITVTAKLLGYSSPLNFRGIASVYISCRTSEALIPNPYHWLYFSEPRISFNRITEPTKFAPQLNLGESNRSYLIAESTFSQTSPFFESIPDLITRTVHDLRATTIFQDLDILDVSANIEPYVYPIQSHENRLQLKRANTYLSQFNNLESIGTGANFAYNDLQVIFSQANELAHDIQSNLSSKFSLSRSFFASHIASIPYTKPTSTSPNLISEIGINHNGNTELLFELIKQCASHCDIIKLQYFSASKRIGSSVRELKHTEKAQDIDETIFELLDRCELATDDLISSVKLIKSLGSVPMITIFSPEDIPLILSLDITYVKTASMDLNNIHLHKTIASQSSPLLVFISTGMSTLVEIETTVSLYAKSKHQIILLLCTSSYPTPLDDVNLGGLCLLKQITPNVGYSDHTVGTQAPILAASMGAQYVEVHYTNNKNATGPDQMISKDIHELQQIYQYFKNIPKITGSSTIGPSHSEFETWRTQKKGLYAASDIQPGEALTFENTYCSSPPTEILPTHIINNITTARKAIMKHSPITFANIY